MGIMVRQRQKNLKKLHVLLSDKNKLEDIFNRIFDEEKHVEIGLSGGLFPYPDLPTDTLA
ncbi:MAG: hypothetical protein L6U16_10355 [Porphyromonadaceae bacterium]|nr:MAG: hypothetical protein L6U16_10355 [Porphyromonadaceae bacterium]